MRRPGCRVQEAWAGRNVRIPVCLAALAACAVAGCFSDPDADRVSREDQRVMRAMVEISCQLGVERVVISSRPAVPRWTDSREAADTQVRFGIDLERRIAREARWPVGQICPVVRVAADAAIESVLARDDESWREFIATFGGARSLMRISLPVYSPDGKRAVLYTVGDCPYTCGAGFFHELEKTPAGWRIAGSINAWTT